jgi:REP element-mobilizing transposase RayT
LLRVSIVARPTRLDRNFYIGLRCYFVTTCTLNRQKAFVEKSFCVAAQDELSAQAIKHGFAVNAYCLMPDHAHILLSARHEGAELTGLVAEWKQRTGFMWWERVAQRLWQKGYWDRVLRDTDEVLSIARYIIENPCRAGLATHPEAYAWAGSGEYTIQEILEASQVDLKTTWRA